MKRILFLFLLMALLVSSSKGGSQKSEAMMMAQDTTSTGGSGSDVIKLIKEADIRFKTGSNEQTEKFIKNSLVAYGAYISEENSFDSSNSEGVDLKIRVPKDKFDAFLTYIFSNVNIKKMDEKISDCKMLPRNTLMARHG